MAYQHNNTYAGLYTLPGGAMVEVKYFDRAEAAATFGPQISRHPGRKGVGWYWQAEQPTALDPWGGEWHGPHRGSLQALLDVVGPPLPTQTTMGAEPEAGQT